MIRAPLVLPMILVSVAGACAGAVVPSAPSRAAPVVPVNSESRQTIVSGRILWLVDGKEVAAERAAGLDPAAIESVSVLKGSAAISRFGQRAANGAVLIVTRNGAAPG